MWKRMSIRRRLLSGLLVTVTIVAAATIWLAYRSAKTEVNLLFDSSLAQEAIVLAELLDHEANEEEQRVITIDQVLAELGEKARQQSPALNAMVQKDRHTADHDDYMRLPVGKNLTHYPYQSKIHYFARYPSGQIMVRSPGTSYFPVSQNGFSTHQLGTVRWRTYTFIMPDTRLLVQLSEQIDVRENSIDHWLIHTFWPLFIMLPLLGIIIWLVIGDSMKRLHRVAQILEQRDPLSLELISVRHIPQEVIPLIVALNHLFQRVDAALENEHEFTSNAAHELRNPLAALKTRIQSFQIKSQKAKEKTFLLDMEKGVDRISHLLDQMLILARADTRQRQIAQKAFDLYQLTEQEFAELAHKGIEKELQLSLFGDRQTINGDTEAIRILVRNLIDNAMKYTPEGGSVRVSVMKQGQHVELVIEDSGPGIPPEQREALFQRFKRGSHQHMAAGSGLGLAIIRRIAELHRAAVLLQTPDNGQGLRVRVIF